MRWMPGGVLLGGMLLAGAARAQSPTLSLGQALRQAADQGFASRSAAAQQKAQAGQAAQSYRGFLPAFRMDVGYIGTTDPLGAFGATLRRREVTRAAFDPASLNNPDDIGQLTSSLVVEQPLLNVDAWYARRASNSSARVAAATYRWVRVESQVAVVRAFYAAVLAADQLRTLEDAAEAARAHTRQAESMHRNGLVTQSDVLLARVRAGEIESQLIAARASLPIARMRLALVLGAPSNSGFILPSRLPPSDRISLFADNLETLNAGARADIEAAELALDAATANKRRVRAQLLPRVNSFGRLDWVTDGPAFGGHEAWTVGIILSWSPFTGGAEWAQQSEAEGRRLDAQAQAEAAQAQGRLEILQARSAVEVALAQMAILDTSVTQSMEAHRIVQRKYEGGLATVFELFDAAAQETATRLGASRAKHDAIIALAERQRAGGADLMPLAALETGE